jgi:hypothetical protein
MYLPLYLFRYSSSCRTSSCRSSGTTLSSTRTTTTGGGVKAMTSLRGASATASSNLFWKRRRRRGRSQHLPPRIVALRESRPPLKRLPSPQTQRSWSSRSTCRRRSTHRRPRRRILPRDLLLVLRGPPPRPAPLLPRRTKNERSPSCFVVAVSILLQYLSCCSIYLVLLLYLASTSTLVPMYYYADNLITRNTSY